MKQYYLLVHIYIQCAQLMLEITLLCRYQINKWQLPLKIDLTLCNAHSKTGILFLSGFILGFWLASIKLIYTAI